MPGSGASVAASKMRAIDSIEMLCTGSDGWSTAGMCQHRAHMLSG